MINIPCYNEEKTLPLVLRELPQRINGIDKIEIQIVDDGSRDKTAYVAQKAGCRVIQHKRNLGLGMAFKHGSEAALKADCDIMVNTDADNQYPSRYIEALVKPIVDGRADMVIGNRKPWKVKHFSPLKRFFQYWGNKVARNIAGSNVPDTVSGFRAYSRESLLRLEVTTKFSYVLDTIVQGSRKGLAIASVPVTTNAPTRRSRLFKNMFQHMRKSAGNVLRCYALYEPFKTFVWTSLIFFIPAIILLVRFFYFLVMGQGNGHVQSLIISAILFFLGGICFTLGILADMIGENRKIAAEQLYLAKKRFYDK